MIAGGGFSATSLSADDIARVIDGGDRMSQAGTALR